MHKKNRDKIYKPNWIKVKLPNNINNIKNVNEILQKNSLHVVCKEASCPNLPICFGRGTATFMILGSICTRNCPFCDVTHGRPLSTLDTNEPERVAKVVQEMNLNHVVITSVNRDDLPDGGAKQFLNCICKIRSFTPNVCIEILVPDFKRKIDIALKIINNNPPDIFNHNMENVPRLYKKVRPGANYKNSLTLLKKFKDFHPNLITKSGLILGLGEKEKEVLEVMKDLRKIGVTMLTLGQYLRPSKKHLPVVKYISPKFFHFMKKKAKEMGFTHVASGPMVRSSYYADIQKERNEETIFSEKYFS